MQTSQNYKTINLREMCKMIAEGTDPSDIEWTWGLQAFWAPLGEVDENPFKEPNTLFRLKKKTVTVNGFEIPAPLTAEPAVGETCYIADPTSRKFFCRLHWFDKTWFKRGLCHSTKENAIMHAKAMLGIDPYKDTE